MAVEMLTREQRIPPSRGLVITHTHSGAPLSVLDLHRWIRYNRLVLKADKIDVLANVNTLGLMHELLDTAEELEVRLSLRTDAVAPPEDLATLKERGLLDVFLCPSGHSLETLETWGAACSDLDIPLRLQLQAPFSSDADVETVASKIQAADIARVNLVASDPFQGNAPCANRAESEATVTVMQSLASAVESKAIEANILGVPLCLVSEESLTRTANSMQCAADHAHYLPEAIEMANTLYNTGPIIAGKILLIHLSRHTLKQQPMDNMLLPFLVRNRYAYFFSRIYRRLSNHLRIFRSVPKEVSKSGYEKERAASRKNAQQELGPVCSQCALQRICDHETKAFKTAFPGMKIHAIEGEHVASVLHFSALQPKYYDELDHLRLEAEDRYEELTEEAAQLITNRQPDRVIGPHDYDVEETHFDRMESGLKWWSVSNNEKISTVLGDFRPPLTLSMDMGAGIADYVGFSFGRHCKIVCPMEAYRHNITLHINADGRYVLLRDKRPVRPSEFEGQHYLPLRLGEKLQPRISIWNIDECIATQNLRVWTQDSEAASPVPTAKYSIIIVSTRFTRRLHAVLRSLAHQNDFDLSTVEVIICYVPGIDATDDLIDGVNLTYPDLHIVRSPFPEQYMNSKGFLINESANIASGEWIMLLDSDTLLPPDYLAKVEAASDGAEFIAPDGRKLLPKDVTAQILMGEIAPWDHWEELLEGAGEFRHRETRGIPVGFCQTFRAKYLERFPYLEVDHFETADMQFGEQMRYFVGTEHRLSGTPVLHLDHGGSQWYGTQKHM